MDRWPHFQIDEDMLCIYQRDGGIAPAAKCVAAHIRLALRVPFPLLLMGLQWASDKQMMRENMVSSLNGSFPVITSPEWRYYSRKVASYCHQTKWRRYLLVPSLSLTHEVQNSIRPRKKRHVVVIYCCFLGFYIKREERTVWSGDRWSCIHMQETDHCGRRLDQRIAFPFWPSLATPHHPGAGSHILISLGLFALDLILKKSHQ